MTDQSPAAQARGTRRASGLVSAIQASESVSRLAANPLLLTIIALIHYQNVKLPERRVELYRVAVEALAESWNRARSLTDEAIDLHLGDKRLDERFVVKVLGPVALWVHEERPDGLVERGALESKIAEILRGEPGITGAPPDEMARSFLDLVRRGSGLLQERGLGLYGFLHLTFKEYLGARAIADLSPEPEKTVLKHWLDPAWREVILLAVGASSPRDATRLVEALLAASAEGEERGKNIVLAGQALADVGRDGVIGGIWAKTVRMLVSLLEERAAGQLVRLQTRVDAGDVLGLLGDPRLTDDAWVDVSAGEFLMGTTKQEVRELVKRHGKHWEDWAKDEVSQRLVHVDAFRIGKYPVTNREFRRFMDAGGYDNRAYWSDDGWKWREHAPEGQEELPEWRQRRERKQPALWDDARYGSRKPNRPVVGVTWYEAEAYCNWLTIKLRGEGKVGQDEIVRLPGEAEWEKAVRGVDGRWWPWGNDWDPGRANTREGAAGGTTPVGIYADGASPYGALDMAGNVWEWCRDWYEGGRSKSLRGGSWLSPAGFARSASRYYDPADYWPGVVGFRCVVVPPGSPRG